MFDFMCMGCGAETSADPKDFYYDQDGDTIYVLYTVKCPKCGRVHKCREVFRWDGIIDME
jgi:DNA-directed RNA polymerase subunit RPC12/RpoP